MEQTVTLSGGGDEQQNHPQEDLSSLNLSGIQGTMEESLAATSIIVNSPAGSDCGQLQEETVPSDQNDHISSAKTLTTDLQLPGLETTSHGHCKDLQSTSYSHPRGGTKGYKSTKEEAGGKVANQSSSIQSERNNRKTDHQASCLLTPECK